MTKTAAHWLLWVVSCVCMTPAVHAQVPAEPVLALEVEPGLLPVDALRMQLEDELGVRIADAGYAGPNVPRLVVQGLSSGNVEVALSSRSVPRASREFALTAERPEERVETVALIAANLVRNEAASLLPDLRPVAEQSEPPSAPKPVAPKLIDPCKVRGDAVFGFDFAPGVGSSSSASGRAATRRVSLGFLGTLSSRLDGLEFSLGANIQKVSVCGAQVTYGANIALGPVTGLQLAVANYAQGNFVGVQAGVANVTLGDFTGAQGGILNVTLGDFTGLLYGTVSYAGGHTTGVQAGIATYTGESFTGAQGGVLAITRGELTGLQAGLTNVSVGGVHGAQLGVASYAGAVQGAQLGIANVSAGVVRGAQVGLVNYADKSRASIGLLSIVRRGRTSIDAFITPDTGTFTAGITHGGKYVHNSYGVGVRFGRDEQLPVVSAAIGVRVLRTSLLHVDIDLVGMHLLSDHMDESNIGTAGLRVPVTFRVFRGLGLVAAPSYNVTITNDENERDPSAFGNTKLHDGSTRVLGYPSLTFGVRYEFDHGV